MIAYGFKAMFAPQLTTGSASPKTLTMRHERKPPSRHANVGEPIGLWTGMRTKDALRRGVGLVTLRALVKFGEGGIAWVQDMVVRDTLDANTEGLHREISEGGNADAFARRDGFERWSALWDWHAKNRIAAERDSRTLVRHVIAWMPLTAEQIAAVDQGQARFDEVA